MNRFCDLPDKLPALIERQVNVRRCLPGDFLQIPQRAWIDGSFMQQCCLPFTFDEGTALIPAFALEPRNALLLEISSQKPARVDFGILETELRLD